jgi:hypothetical protein
MVTKRLLRVCKGDSSGVCVCVRGFTHLPDPDGPMTAHRPPAMLPHHTVHKQALRERDPDNRIQRTDTSLDLHSPYATL